MSRGIVLAGSRRGRLVGVSFGALWFGALGLGAIALCVAGASSGAAADDTGTGAGFEVPSAGLEAARAAFERHAKSWMADLERNEAENRRKAPVYSVANESVIRFDGYGDEYETQVKPTGHATAPYVGILRYKENLYSCLASDSSRCTITRSVPVSEIFSYKNGRWTY